ncbi:flocculation protein FLO11-like isoform X2 [Pomacea canaliculata]|nr:flocculation protein FLO11-like isoform X2 [Pomacea canaliculata]
MSVLGYIPDTVTSVSDDGNTTTMTTVPRDARYYATKSLSYAGPVLMGFGFFAIIISCVLYCEIVDRYTVIMPKKPETRIKRRDIMNMIVSEFKKSYFRGIEVPLRKQEPVTQQKGEREKETLLKALSISTPVLLMSPDLAPTWRFSHYAYRYPGRRHMALKPRHPKLKQLGGSSGSSGHEPWLKTSSLPNICDPDIRRHDLPRPVPLDQHEVTRVRRMKRFGRPCRSMDNRISWSLPHTLSRSTTGVDNPAYLHEQDRKKSLSMCVHPEIGVSGTTRRPHARFVKASQMQPRTRLLQQQQQQMQKQQNQQQQQQQLQQQQQQQKQQQNQNKQKNLQQQRSQDSTESIEKRRSESDQSKPRQRPKLTRTKATHASFDVSDTSFASLLPAEPPPFPPPYKIKKQEVPAGPSPRTSKLLRARAKSEEGKEKKKPEMILLKDLFRSFDVHDDAFLSVSPVATASSAPGSTSAMVYLDPLAGQRCEVLRPASTQQSQKDRCHIHVINRDGGYTAVDSTGLTTSGPFKTIVAVNSEASSAKAAEADEQCYQLPLLSGVLRAHSQCDVKQRTNVIRYSRETEKSLSLDTKDRVPGVDARPAEIQRAHSFNVTDYDADAKAAHSSAAKKLHSEKVSSNRLRVFGAPSNRSRPKSWDGDKSHSLDTPDLDKGTVCSLTVPRLDRANSFEPIGNVGLKVKQCNLSSQGSPSDEPVHSCSFRIDDETKTGKHGSDEIRQKTPIPTVTLTVPLPAVLIQPPVENNKSEKLQSRRQHRLKKQQTVVQNPLYQQPRETKEKPGSTMLDRGQKNQPSSSCHVEMGHKQSACQMQGTVQQGHVTLRQSLPSAAQPPHDLNGGPKQGSVIVHRAAVHLPADCVIDKRAPSTSPALLPHLPPPPPSPSPLTSPSMIPGGLLLSPTSSSSSPLFSLPAPPPSPMTLLISSPLSSGSSLFAPPSPSSPSTPRSTPTSMLLSKASALLQPGSATSSRPATPSPAQTTTPTSVNPTTLMSSLSTETCSVGGGGAGGLGGGCRRSVSPVARRSRLRTRSLAVEGSSEEEYTENTPLIQTLAVHSSSSSNCKQ